MVKRIVRCAATEVDPDTGIRDLESAHADEDLRPCDCGVYAEVIEADEIEIGDAMPFRIVNVAHRHRKTLFSLPLVGRVDREEAKPTRAGWGMRDRATYPGALGAPILTERSDLRIRRTNPERQRPRHLLQRLALRGTAKNAAINPAAIISTAPSR